MQNIARLIRNRSAKAPGVILKLSDLLSYILYDNDRESVPLNQEWQMVREYLALKKIFYSDLLVVRLEEKGNVTGMTIAPLTLLSLVQNCCEQFQISIQEKLSIEIDLEARRETKQLSFALRCNGHYERINGMPGTGLAQALRRIEVIYQGRHQIETNTNKDIFSLWLLLDLEAHLSTLEKEKQPQALYDTP